MTVLTDIEIGIDEVFIELSSLLTSISYSRLVDSGYDVVSGEVSEKDDTGSPYVINALVYKAKDSKIPVHGESELTSNRVIDEKCIVKQDDLSFRPDDSDQITFNNKVHRIVDFAEDPSHTICIFDLVVNK